MGAKAKTEENVAETPELKKPQEGKATKFLIEKLRENSLKLFGVTTSTFDGAMYGHKETEFSIDEAKAILDAFLYGKEGK